MPEKFISIELVGLGWEKEKTDEIYEKLQVELAIFLTKTKWVGTLKNCRVSICDRLDKLHFLEGRWVLAKEGSMLEVP